jgi:hypothetical protein
VDIFPKLRGSISEAVSKAAINILKIFASRTDIRKISLPEYLDIVNRYAFFDEFL